MNVFLKWLAGAAMLASVISHASAHDDTDQVTQSRTVDAKTVRVQVEGIVNLVLRQGDPARLVLKGKQRWLDRTITRQDGDTLRIEAEDEDNGVRISKQGIHAELTLPSLRSVTTESFGSTDVRGFSGESLDIALEGAGSMKVACKYKFVNASLGGLGSMEIDGGALDALDLDLRGAGLVTLSGSARSLKADLGGLGSLDAKSFRVQNVELDLSGLGNATVNATRDARLDLSGLGSVTVFGNPPSRKVSVNGLGNVSWK